METTGLETRTGSIEKTKKMKEILRAVVAVEEVAWELEVVEVMLAWLREARDQDAEVDLVEEDPADLVETVQLARLILGIPLALRSSKMRGRE